MSRGQGNELLNKLEAAGFGGELAQKVIDSKGNALAAEVVRCIVNFGKPAEGFYDFEAKYPESQPTFMTSAYFVSRPGLSVSRDFTSRITAAYPEALVPRGLDGVESFDLARSNYDREVLEYPEMRDEENVREHAFTPDQIAALIDLQPEGVAGKLNRYSNVFFVVGKGGDLFAVFVHWDADYHEWRVSVCELGGIGSWNAGARVFRNTQVLKT